ncbi:MAG: glycosyltransferase family 39 protein [Nitrospirota bacterium]
MGLLTLRGALQPRVVLAAWLLLELLFQAARVDFNSLRYDEAQAIVIGRDVLQGGPCPDCAQHTGSVYLHPVLAALAYDHLAPVLGHWGGRAVSIALGLLLTAAVYGIGRLLFDSTIGVLAAVLLTLQAPMLYVAKVGLYDIVAATFLGLAAWSLALAKAKPAASGAALFMGGVALGVSGLSKFAAAVYLPVGIVLVLWQFGWRRWLAYFLPGLAIVLAGFAATEILPRLPVLEAMTESTVALGRGGFSRGDIMDMLMRWLFWATLPALAGLADRPSRSTVAVLLLLALPQPLIHLATGAEQGLHKNIVQSLLFLAPAAAVGVRKLLHDLLKIPGAIDLRPAGYGLLILLLGAGMVKNLQWLERQYPNTDPAVAFLLDHVRQDSVLLAEEGYIYHLYLGPRLPLERLYGTYYLEYRNATGTDALTRFVEDGVPDFIVLTSYGTPVQDAAIAEAAAGRYRLTLEYDGGVSWGTRMVQIYQRFDHVPR